MDLLRRGRLPITVTSLVSHLSLYLVLLVALRQVGVGEAVVSWAEVLAVFAFGLVAAGGAATQVTAAVLVYRALDAMLADLVRPGPARAASRPVPDPAAGGH